MPRTRRSLEALKRLRAREQAWLGSSFVSPCLRGHDLVARLDGVVMPLRVLDAGFEGWGVFEPRNRSEAILVRPASRRERGDALKRFPSVRVVITGQAGDHWFGAPYGDADRRHVTGHVPIMLPDDRLQLFDCVRVRPDGGGGWWYDHIDRSRRRVIGGHLRRCLDELSEDPSISGLTQVERDVYAEVLARHVEQ